MLRLKRRIPKFPGGRKKFTMVEGELYRLNKSGKALRRGTNKEYLRFTEYR